MAHPDLPQPQNPWTARMRAEFGPAYDAVAELGRDFPGPIGVQIAGWQKEGLGRVIAARLPGSMGPNRHKNMMYAIPHSVASAEPNDQRVLLVFPTEQSFSVRLVKPAIVKYGDEYLNARQNESALSSFGLLFDPHNKPSFVDGWEPDPREATLTSFTKDIALFPLRLVSTDNAPSQTLLDQAVEYARGLRRKKHLQELRRDEAALTELVGLDTEETVVFHELLIQMGRSPKGEEGNR